MPGVKFAPEAEELVKVFRLEDPDCYVDLRQIYLWILREETCAESPWWMLDDDRAQRQMNFYGMSAEDFISTIAVERDGNPEITLDHIMRTICTFYLGHRIVRWVSPKEWR